MRAIRRTDTKPELALRSALHRLGYRLPQGLPAGPGRRQAGPAGHRVHRAPGGRLRGRLLLARLPRARPQARGQRVVLGPEAAPQRRARPGRRRGADAGRLARWSGCGSTCRWTRPSRTVVARAGRATVSLSAVRPRSPRRWQTRITPRCRSACVYPPPELPGNHMRVYLPVDPARPGAGPAAPAEIGPARCPASRSRPRCASAYASGDLEELEYAAMMQAARASLRLLRGRPGGAAAAGWCWPPRCRPSR